MKRFIIIASIGIVIIVIVLFGIGMVFGYGIPTNITCAGFAGKDCPPSLVCKVPSGGYDMLGVCVFNPFLLFP